MVYYIQLMRERAVRVLPTPVTYERGLFAMSKSIYMSLSTLSTSSLERIRREALLRSYRFFESTGEFSPALEAVVTEARRVLRDRKDFLASGCGAWRVRENRHHRRHLCSCADAFPKRVPKERRRYSCCWAVPYRPEW